MSLRSPSGAGGGVDSPADLPHRAPLLRSPSEVGQPRPRPILCRNRSVTGGRPGAQKRSVTFQLPADGEAGRGRVATLALSLWKLTTAAGRAKPEKATRRILRRPVAHVHVRGASGLPTRRVPLSSAAPTAWS